MIAKFEVELTFNSRQRHKIIQAAQNAKREVVNPNEIYDDAGNKATIEDMLPDLQTALIEIVQRAIDDDDRFNELVGVNGVSGPGPLPGDPKPPAKKEGVQGGFVYQEMKGRK